MKIKTIVCSTVIAGLLLVPALVKAEDKDKDEDGQKVAWKDVPAAVQNTITANANGGKVGKVETETENNQVTYEAVVKGTDGKKSEVEVAADGTLISVKAKGEEKEEKDGDKEKDDDDK